MNPCSGCVQNNFEIIVKRYFDDAKPVYEQGRQVLLLKYHSCGAYIEVLRK